MPRPHHADTHDPYQPVNRARPGSVALETTLLVHGVPRGHGLSLARQLDAIVRTHGALPAFVGLYRGTPTMGLSEPELAELLGADNVQKANTANLGILMHQRSHGATTVATTMELAAAAGIRLFATGGLGGVHPGYAQKLDISADLAAFARFPVAVVTSGVKAILEVESTREALETLGIPVVGYRTDAFPAFYLRESAARVDARFDDAADLAAFIKGELARTARGIVVANPIPEADQIDRADWDRWLTQARARVATQGIAGPAVTPSFLSALHEVSGGRTLVANIALAKANAELAARLAAALGAGTTPG